MHKSAEHCIKVQNIWSRFGHATKKDPPPDSANPDRRGACGWRLDIFSEIKTDLWLRLKVMQRLRLKGGGKADVRCELRKRPLGGRSEHSLQLCKWPLCHFAIEVQELAN